jgi:hypothetical protein
VEELGIDQLPVSKTIVQVSKTARGVIEFDRRSAAELPDIFSDAKNVSRLPDGCCHAVPLNAEHRMGQRSFNEKICQNEKEENQRRERETHGTLIGGELDCFAGRAGSRPPARAVVA